MSIDFDQFPLDMIGRGVGLVGVVYGEEGTSTSYVFLFPEHADGYAITHGVDVDLDEFGTLIRQTDLIEMPVAVKDEHGKVYKAIVRKCQRRIEQGVSWGVFKRDGYTCRYCGRDGLPLTVDHLVLWEEGGPSIPENLLTACRKCNKTRGNKQYADWLSHPYYLQVSKNLSAEVREANEAIVPTLDSIERVYKQRSR